jgi:hypothetical protein
VLAILPASHGKSQTRILPPTLEFSQTKIKDKKSSVDIEIPVPVAFPWSMPFLKFQDRTKSEEDQFARDRHIRVGLLHHAAEGAPLWKASLGPWSDHGNRFGVSTESLLNIEKIFPKLRPNNSDKLESWIQMTTLTPNHGHTLFAPEAGWTWRSGDGLVIDFIVPRKIMVGWVEGEWLGKMGYKESNFFETVSEDSVKIKKTRSQYLVVEAERGVGLDCSLTLSAGMQLPRAPHFGLGVSWNPQN